MWNKLKKGRDRPIFLKNCESPRSVNGGVYVGFPISVRVLPLETQSVWIAIRKTFVVFDARCRRRRRWWRLKPFQLNPDNNWMTGEGQERPLFNPF